MIRHNAHSAWSAERDRRYERSRTASYVSRQMVGYADKTATFASAVRA